MTDDLAAIPEAPANEVRGEIAVSLGEKGKEYVLRPSFAAIQEIETATGKGILRLSEDCREGNLSLAATALILSACIRAQGRETGDKMLAAVDPERLAEMAMCAPGGIAAVQGRLQVLMFWAATGGYTASGELKPAEELARIATMLAPPVPQEA